MRKLVIVLLSFLPIFVKANDYIKVDCPTYDVGTEIICNISGHTEYGIKAVEYKYRIPPEISINEFIKDDIWEGDKVDNTLYLYTNKEVIGDYQIGKFKIKINEEIDRINLIDEKLIYTDDSFEDHDMLSVKSVENKEEEKNKKSYYVIIIIGIMILLITILIILYKRRMKI